MIGSDGVAFSQLADHSMKMYVRAGENQQHISGMITRVIKLETNDCCLPVLLLHCFKLEIVRTDNIGL